METKYPPKAYKPKNHIAAFYPAEETGDNHKRKDQQHDSHKSDKSINTIDPLQWL